VSDPQKPMPPDSSRGVRRGIGPARHAEQERPADWRGGWLRLPGGASPEEGARICTPRRQRASRPATATGGQPAQSHRAKAPQARFNLSRSQKQASCTGQERRRANRRRLPAAPHRRLAPGARFCSNFHHQGGRRCSSRPGNRWAIQQQAALGVRAAHAANQGDQQAEAKAAPTFLRRWPSMPHGAASARKWLTSAQPQPGARHALRVPAKGCYLHGQESGCDHPGSQPGGVGRPVGLELEPAIQRLPPGSARCAASRTGLAAPAWAPGTGAECLGSATQRTAGPAAQEGIFALAVRPQAPARRRSPPRPATLLDAIQASQHPWQTPIHQMSSWAKSSSALWPR